MTMKTARTFALWLILGMSLVFSASAQSIPPTPKVTSRPPQTLLDLKYNPTGTLLAEVQASGRLVVHRVEDDVIVLDHHTDLVHPLFKAQVAWSPDGKTLAAGIGGQIQLWDVEAAQLVEAIDVGVDDPLIYFESGEYIPEGIVSLQWNRSGSAIMSQSLGSRYTIWSMEQQHFLFDRIAGNNPIPVVWLEDQKRLSNGDLYVDLNSEEQRLFSQQPVLLGHYYEHCSGFVRSVGVNSAGTQIVWGTINGCLVIIDVEKAEQIAVYKLGEDTIQDLSWSPDGELIAAVDDNGQTHVVDITSGRAWTMGEAGNLLLAVDLSSEAGIAIGGVSIQSDSRIFEMISARNLASVLTLDHARALEFTVTPPADD